MSQPSSHPPARESTSLVVRDDVHPLTAQTVPSAIVITTHDSLLRAFPAPIPAPRRWGKMALVSGLLLAALSTGSYLYYRPGKAVRPPALEETVLVQRAPLQVCVLEHGTIESQDCVEIAAPIVGPPMKLESMMPYGAKVTKGQVVATLDASALQTAIAEQTAKFQLAETKHKDAEEALEAAKSKQESDLAAGKLQVDFAQLDYDRYVHEEKQVELNDRRGAIAMAERDLREAEEKLSYFRTFHKRGFITSEQLKAKETEVSRARFALNQNQARLKIFEKYQMPKQETQLKALLDDVKRTFCRTQKSSAIALAKASAEVRLCKQSMQTEQDKLQQLTTQINLVQLRAPRDGVLAAPIVSDPAKPRPAVGGMVQPAQVIYVLPDYSKLFVSVRLDEEEAAKLRKGHAARILLESDELPTLEGAIENITFQAEPAMAKGETQHRDFVALIVLDSQKLHTNLKLGQKARVEIPIGHVEDAIQIPLPAVTSKEGKHFAYVRCPMGIEEREIRLGASDGKSLEVKEGIEVGEKVVLHPRAKFVDLKEGDSIASKSTGQVTP